MSSHGHHDEPHLPHGSIWPFWLANAIALFGLGMIFVHSTPAVVAMGLLAILLVLFMWVKEDYGWWKTNTGTGPGIAKAGTLLFISSEVFIFGALFTTYFTFQRLAVHWPDVDVHLPIVKTGIFTLFLFASRGPIHKAEKHLMAGNHKGFRNWWLMTIILGAIFLGGQVWEYATLLGEGHGLTAGQFMTSFYMVTGTHGLHVLGGLIYLIIVYVRASKGQFDQHRHAAPETAALYWHFVDLVWVLVFTVFYIVPTYFLH
jgi:cytochrome c oxidase subunit 3